MPHNASHDHQIHKFPQHSLNYWQLKDYIQHHLQCHKPVALSQAYWLVKRLEHTQPQTKKPTFSLPQKCQKPWYKDKEQQDNSKQSIAELKAAGKCFKCLEPWVPGHGKVCKGKQFYSLVLVQDEEGHDKVTLVDDTEVNPEELVETQLHTLRISLHALYGTTSQVSTFTLQVKIGTRIATALVDSGSDVSFINAKFAVKTYCTISTVSKVQIVAVDGN